MEHNPYIGSLAPDGKIEDLSSQMSQMPPDLPHHGGIRNPLRTLTCNPSLPSATTAGIPSAVPSGDVGIRTAAGLTSVHFAHMEHSTSVMQDSLSVPPGGLHTILPVHSDGGKALYGPIPFNLNSTVIMEILPIHPGVYMQDEGVGGVSQPHSCHAVPMTAMGAQNMYVTSVPLSNFIQPSAGQQTLPIGSPVSHPLQHVPPPLQHVPQMAGSNHCHHDVSVEDVTSPVNGASAALSALAGSISTVQTCNAEPPVEVCAAEFSARR